MKRILLFCSLVVLGGSALFSAAVGPALLRWDDSPQREMLPDSQGKEGIQRFFAAEIGKGNLQIARVYQDAAAGLLDTRYQQYYQGLPVFGGQVVQHSKNQAALRYSGEYYSVSGLNTTPALQRADVLAVLRTALNRPGLTEKADNGRLVVYPVRDGDCRLAYQLVVRDGEHFNETALVDAHSGEILLQYSNERFDAAAIGIGTGFHGTLFKLPTLFKSANSQYYLCDVRGFRPITMYLYDISAGGLMPTDSDNNWSNCGDLVSAYANVGFVYDFYYQVMNRNSTDGNGKAIKIRARDGRYKDNASWDGEFLNFYVPSRSSGPQYGAALDVVGHEFTHGVDEAENGLIYQYESGALDESMADIGGTAVEFYFHAAGTGLHRADWLNAEDACLTYDQAFAAGIVRAQDDPNRFSQSNGYLGPDPCHLSQYIRTTLDNGGVHLNCTIFPHAFYLLSNGGTNKVSGLSVSGIGIDKAFRIYYRAWMNYLTPTSKFLDAANGLLHAASDLYGAQSNEYNQVLQSMLAIGFTRS